MSGKPASTVLCEAIVAEFVSHAQWCAEVATGSVDCDDAWCRDEEHAHWVCPEHGGPPPAKPEHWTDAEGIRRCVDHDDALCPTCAKSEGAAS